MQRHFSLLIFFIDIFFYFFIFKKIITNIFANKKKIQTFLKCKTLIHSYRKLRHKKTKKGNSLFGIGIWYDEKLWDLRVTTWLGYQKRLSH